MDSHILNAGNASSWSRERSGVEVTGSGAAPSAMAGIVKLDIVLILGRQAGAAAETGMKRGLRCRAVSHSLDSMHITRVNGFP